jgi:hypothetical protein
VGGTSNAKRRNSENCIQKNKTVPVGIYSSIKDGGGTMCSIKEAGNVVELECPRYCD